MSKIAITMGDPSGIGPEISLKMLANHGEYKNDCIIYGSRDILEYYKDILKIEEEINYIKSTDDFIEGKINVLNIESNQEIKIGKVDPYSGRQAYEYIKAAINDALERKVSAVVTCPINKESLNKGGIHYQGHTEIFADLTNTRSYSMMLWSEKLIVNHVSTHVPLKKACDLVKKDRILECIELLNQALIKLKGDNYKLAVAGLNPHAGENSMFGNQEANEIAPAVKEAIEKNIPVEGPVPPDTVFFKAVP